MDRLTFEGNFCEIAMCQSRVLCKDRTCSAKRTWERLKEYEDTEEKGLLVRLRCAVGETVHITEARYRGKKCVGTQISIGAIDHITIGQAQKPLYTICTETGNWYEGLEQEDFYLTREEAEADLEEADGG
jgi:hypothetical protein